MTKKDLINALSEFDDDLEIRLEITNSESVDDILISDVGDMEMSSCNGKLYIGAYYTYNPDDYDSRGFLKRF